MPETLAQDTFVRSYTDRGYRHVALVRHQGTLLAFALDDGRQIVYSAMDSSRGERDADDWNEQPLPLRFPTELALAGFGAAEQTLLPAIRKSTHKPVADRTLLSDEDTDFFQSSTARLTADVPFQVVSDGDVLHVFRQSVGADHPDALKTADGVAMVDSSLLVDRFILVGGAQLTPKREVRFQRSRSRTQPEGQKDTLGAEDLDKQPFFEPTRVLRFIPPLTDGRFAALLVPTQVANVSRWQLFVHNARSGAIDAFSIERSSDGLFNTRGETFLTCVDHPDVFALEPGTCSAPAVGDPTQTCGLQLVPVADRGGYAGAALDLSAPGAFVEFDDPQPLGPSFTLELWLATPAEAGPDPAAILGSGNAATANDGPSLAVVEQRRLQIGWGDGSSFRSTLTPPVLDPGSWQHVAASFDGTWVRVYVDGRLRHRSGELHDCVPAEGAVTTQLGAPANGFTGTVDELRIWSYVRAAGDIQSSIGRRLSGLEPDLLRYWRLDEGRGDVIRDQTGSGATAAVHGATWVTSGAPVADTAGISRTSLRVAGREVVTGLSALLYNQQERAASGYDRAPKPLKQAARVMLAFGSTRAQKQTAEVAVLDFGVGVDGRLAQLDGEVALANRSAPRPGGDPDVDWDEREDQQAILESCQKLMATLPVVAEADDPLAALADAAFSLGDNVPDEPPPSSRRRWTRGRPRSPAPRSRRCWPSRPGPR